MTLTLHMYSTCGLINHQKCGVQSFCHQQVAHTGNMDEWASEGIHVPPYILQVHVGLIRTMDVTDPEITIFNSQA